MYSCLICSSPSKMISWWSSTFIRILTELCQKPQETKCKQYQSTIISAYVWKKKKKHQKHAWRWTPVRNTQFTKSNRSSLLLSNPFINLLLFSWNLLASSHFWIFLTPTNFLLKTTSSLDMGLLFFGMGTHSSFISVCSYPFSPTRSEKQETLPSWV